MLKWNEAFATGVKLVDLQHQRLIDNINALEALVAAPASSRESCDQLMSFLVKYVSTHFKFEEICMESYRCPAHAQNQREHAAFQEIIAGFERQYRVAGPTTELLRNLHHTTSQWIERHILTVDIRLRGCAGSHSSPAAPRVESAAAVREKAGRQSAAV
jgi:hemerythrin